MKSVAKLLLIDKDNKFLLLYRNEHPVFGNDPDLPGGTKEASETPTETMLREVHEEAGVVINAVDIQELYSGTDYSATDTIYVLFVTTVVEQPKIAISWEHHSYEWLDREKFLEKVENAKDSYMQMVFDILRQHDLTSNRIAYPI